MKISTYLVFALAIATGLGLWRGRQYSRAIVSWLLAALLAVMLAGCAHSHTAVGVEYGGIKVSVVTELQR